MLRHTITQVFKCPFDPVYNCIADFKRYGEVHPYMVEVQVTKGDKESAKYYNVHEDFLLYGFIPMRPSYMVETTVPEKGKHVRYYSTVAKGVHLTIDFNFECDNATGCTKIIEQIQLDAPIVIRTIFMGILKTAHKLFYDKLQETVK